MQRLMKKYLTHEVSAPSFVYHVSVTTNKMIGALEFDASLFHEPDMKHISVLLFPHHGNLPDKQNRAFGVSRFFRIFRQNSFKQKFGIATPQIRMIHQTKSHKPTNKASSEKPLDNSGLLKDVKTRKQNKELMEIGVVPNIS